MSASHLNLRGLRASLGAGAADTSSGDDSAYSRRQIFGLAGSAAASVGLWSMAPVPLGDTSGSFALWTQRDRVEFRLGDTARWVIDTSWFAGTPRLEVAEEPQRTRIRLSGARYPGTGIPADLVAEVRRGRLGRRLKLELAFGNFAGEVPLEPWLRGDVALTRRLDLSNQLIAGGPGPRVQATGRGTLRFSPNWDLNLDGDRLIRVHGLGAPTTADAVRVSLLQPTAGGLLADAPAKRSLLTMTAGSGGWPLWAPLRRTESAGVTWTRNPFDALLLETGEDSGEAPRRALLATGHSADPALRFRPGLNAPGPDGRSFELPLTNPRFAVAFDSAGEQTALFARYGPEPAWLHGDGVSLLLGDGPETPPFELVIGPGQPARIASRPALLRVHAPLEGALAEFGPPPTGTTFDLAPLMPAAGADGPAAGQIRGAPLRVIPPLRLIPFNFTVSVLRPQDLLALRFEFINMSLQPKNGTGPRMVRTDAAKPAYMIVHFPPQNVAERAYFETEDPEGGDTPFLPVPTQSRLAGESRLAFQVPDSIESIPYTIEGLLDWTGLPLNVAATAQPRPELRTIIAVPDDLTIKPIDPRSRIIDPPIIDPGFTDPKVVAPIVIFQIIPQIQEPANNQTAIETPWQLILSPNKFAGWAHARGLVTHNDRTELWHTRLAIRKNDGTIDEQSAYQRALRAIWTPGYDKNTVPAEGDDGPFLMSVTPRDRYEFVRLTSDYTIPNYTPQPVQAERFMLTALGAWMNTRGAWEPPVAQPQALSREEWRHIGTMGRDQYVRVVEKGYLFPFGHRASLVKITERKFQRVRSGPLAGSIAAFLRKRQFIVVRQPEKLYPIPGQAKSGRKMPFKLVRVVTQTTPNLEPSIDIGGDAFWPRVGGQDFLFHLVGEDSDGQRTEFTAPLVFVPNAVAQTTGVNMNAVINDYKSGASSRRKRNFFGQKVAFAESSDEKPGDTTLETVQITFEGELPDPVNASVPFDQPKFFPAIKEAKVRLPAVEQLTGKSAPATIKLHDVYLDHAFSDNPNKSTVFAEVLNTVSAALDPDKAGGVISPNMAIKGLSRAFGPVGGDVAAMVANGFDPAAFFQGVEAKILGAIDLQDIIKAVGLADLGGSGEKVPKITNRVIYPKVDGKEDKTQLPEALETKFVWNPDVENDPFNLFVVDQGANPTALSINALALTKFQAPEESKFEVVGSLTDFRIDLIAPVVTFLKLEFNELGFTSKNGAKPDVKVDIENVTFAGPLSFVNALDDFLSFNSPGPAIDVTASGITALYTLGLPNITVGVFSLQNISLSAGLNIPFNGTPVMARFAFCTRDDPFLLTVSMFGGGGFFGIALSPTGIEILEVSLEFGGSLSFDIGVASGGVYVMAGIYFKMAGDEVELTGYLELGGAVSVLGLITLSIEFYLGLTYQSAGNKVWGQATLTVHIELLFFSIPVEMTVERQFAGDESDPTFQQLVPTQADWDAYADAFAA